MTTGRVASIRARLLARARAGGEDFNRTLNRYGLERFLYRLSISASRDRFCLKGALLFGLWFDLPHRPTRDADFLGFDPPDRERLSATLRGICAIEVDDGMAYDPASVEVEEIRLEDRYGGLRARLWGRLGTARCRLQLDVGNGDVVVPAAEEVVLPTLLDDVQPPRLRCYSRETVFAEKLETIVRMGVANSRMKDYFDLHALIQEGRLDSATLARAVSATFERRETVLPSGVPIGLSDEFVTDPAKREQWAAFVRKDELVAPELAEMVRGIRLFVLALLDG